MADETTQETIDRLTTILQKGVTSWSHGGRSGTYDLAAIRRERDRLQAQLNGTNGRNIRIGRYNSAYRG